MSSEVKSHLALHMALFTISYLRTFSEMLELPFSQRRRKAVLRGTVQLRQRQGLQQWRRRRRRQPLRAQQGPMIGSLFQGSRRFTHTSKSCLSPAPGRRSVKIVSLSSTPLLTWTMHTKTSRLNNLQGAS